MFDYIIGLALLLSLYKHINFFLIKRRLKKRSYEIRNGAEPFYYSGNETGILLLHGFTGTPAIWRSFAKELNQKGYTVYSPLLPGHGTSPEHLCVTKLREWSACIENSIRRLQKNCKKVIVVGLSFSGNLALTA